ncbi:cytochrome c biogenesis heme-transporting ATPase CcmA [Mixta tenebrionis]|uniref:Cytochrome c biogenesis heme-transporting ATPase CcmA n=1 Tax=Mixta tenebrionis TaxID=2562439 RepID=A0A506V172_9GAMM|nr:MULTISPECIES: cytochrome c biogenesis heme-transporting ATPase CcmA [Mixta]QHM74736.1 Cytochrome c biogenesis ATP-binding export protein CcmA [Mixta theicola]TPW39226.1 cytochrome c biogenesis heme-transporting ATPase CcmA [Mixta tenebrionis]
MLEAINLTCIRDERTLFSELHFAINRGDIVQIEGPNGAGKTTLLRVLTGLSGADRGEVRWQGEALRRQRERWHRDLLFLGHQPGVKNVLSPLENLAFYHAECHEEQRFAALEAVDLLGFEEVAVAQLSAGQQRRVALARLWLSEAPVWILDEPLTAIDVNGVGKLMALFVQHAQRGGLVILTTHQPLPSAAWPLRKISLTAGEAN